MPLSPEGFWVPNLSPKQLEIYNCYKRYILVSGPRKSSKCVSSNTILRTNKGLIRIGSLGNPAKDAFIDIDIGVTSLSTNSTHLTVGAASKLYRNPCGEALEIVTDRGHRLIGSHEHPIWCCNDGQFGYMALDSICKAISSGKEIWTPIDCSEFEWPKEYKTVDVPNDRQKDIIKIAAWETFKALGLQDASLSFSTKCRLAKTTTRTIHEFLKNPDQSQGVSKVTIDEDVGYLIGVMVGDGCMSPTVTANYACSFSSADPEIVNSVGETVGRLGGSIKKRGKGYDYSIKSPLLFRLFGELEMRQYSYDKRVPEAVLCSPKTVVRAFLQGLFDTDGYISKVGDVLFCSTSKLLAHDVSQILLCFGIHTSIQFHVNNHKGAWILHLNSCSKRFYDRVGFRLARKQQGVHRRRTRHGHIFTYPPSIKSVLKSIWATRSDRGLIGKFTRKERRGNFESILGTNIRPHARRVKTFCDMLDGWRHADIHKYYLGGNVNWEKVQEIIPVEADLLDLEVQDHHSFSGGGFLNHNTIGNEHRISRHIWETDRGCVALFSKTVKTSKEGGVWKDLTEIIWPEWFASGTGFRYVKEPRQDGQTRTMLCKIANMHGNHTTVYLNSLEHVSQVEDKLKERRFSMVYFGELSKFETRNVFTIARSALRMPHLAYEDHMFLADTNPADDGEDSWIYKLWYQERLQEDHPDPQFQKDLHLIEIMMTENPFLSHREMMDEVAACRYDPDLYARYIQGKWVKASKGTFFSLNFKPESHVVGNILPIKESDWEIILPSDSCSTLYCGWDIGDKNPAFVMMEKRFLDTDPAKPFNVYNVLDELVVNNLAVGLEDFVDAVLEIMEKWETFLGRKIQWVHWSDTSSFGHKIIADATEALRVTQFSGGKIQLQGVQKFAGSVRKRVELTNRLLFENRLYFSANCVKVIEMIKSLRRGSSRVEYVADTDEKDVFDAFSYVLISEEPKDLALQLYPRVGKRSEIIAA